MKNFKLGQEVTYKSKRTGEIVKGEVATIGGKSIGVMSHYVNGMETIWFTEIDEVMIKKSFIPFAGCDETQIAIRTTFADKGINAIRTYYAKRNELSNDARNTVINIFESLANGNDADAEIAAETISKY